jgi:integrase
VYLKYPGQKQVTRVIGGRTVTEARHVLTCYLNKDVEYLQRGNTRFEEYAAVWIERRKLELKPSTYDRCKLYINKHKLHYEYPEAYHFTVEDLKRYLEQVSDEYYPFFLLLWNTGLRFPEAVALKWYDIYRKKCFKHHPFDIQE